MSKKTIAIIVSCIIISAILSKLFSYTGNDIINYDTILNLEIAFFSVSLAIVALMITILDKYKEKVVNLKEWSAKSFYVLKEISENTIALLIIIIILIFASIIKPLLTIIPHINVMFTVLLFSISISLIVMLDTTLSVHKLVINLKDILSETNNKELHLSKKENDIIDAYRFLNEQHKKTFEDLLCSLTTNQQIDSLKKDK